MTVRHAQGQQHVDCEAGVSTRHLSKPEAPSFEKAAATPLVSAMGRETSRVRLDRVVTTDK